MSRSEEGGGPNPKDAKARGLSWLVLSFKHADGSKQEVKGGFSKAQALEIFRFAWMQPEDHPEPLAMPKELIDAEVARLAARQEKLSRRKKP